MRLLRRPRCPQAMSDLAAYLTIESVYDRQYCKRNGEQHERHAIRIGVLQRLHVIVDIDRDRTRHSRQITSDHEYDAKLAHSVGEAEHQGCHDTGNREGRMTRQNVRRRPAPSTAEASRSLRSTDSNEAMRGCTANGKL